jgi:hypothetical protein
MVERGGFEPPVPRGFLWTELGAGLAHYSARQEASVLERICSPGIRQSRLSGSSALGRCVVDASLTQSESSTDKAGLLGEFKRRAGFAAA